MGLNKMGRALFGVFAVVAGSLVVGCAAGDAGEDSTSESQEGSKESAEEAVPGVETDMVSTTATTCPPPGTCSQASRTCLNPKLGGTWCTILFQCLSCPR